MRTNPSQPVELLTTEQAAERLGLRPQTLCVWRTTGRYDLPYHKSGRLVRYAAADVDAWLAGRRFVHTGQVEG